MIFYFYLPFLSGNGDADAVNEVMLRNDVHNESPESKASNGTELHQNEKVPPSQKETISTELPTTDAKAPHSESGEKVDLAASDSGVSASNEIGAVSEVKRDSEPEESLIVENGTENKVIDKETTEECLPDTHLENLTPAETEEASLDGKAKNENLDVSPPDSKRGKVSDFISMIK